MTMHARINMSDDAVLAKYQKVIDALTSRVNELVAAGETSQMSLFSSGSMQAKLLDLPTSGSLVDRSWAVYAEALRARFLGGAKWPNLQLVTIPEAVRWDDPNYSDYYLFKAGDEMPSVGISRSPSTRSFVDHYHAFITDIAAPVVDEGARNQARSALADAIAAEKHHFALEDLFADRWHAYDRWQRKQFPNSPGRWLSIDEWYVQHANAALDADRNIIDTNYAKMYHFLQIAYGGQEILIEEVKERFTSFAKLKVKAPKASDGLPDRMLDIYPYNLDESFPQWLADARAGGKLQNTTFELSASSDTYDYSRTEIAGAVGIGFGFFGIIGGGHRTTINIDSTHKDYALSFDGQVAMFHLSPGTWFNSIALESYRNGAFDPNSQMELLKKTTGIFGPEGFLNFRAARYIVAYKPVVKVKFSEADYHYFYQQTRGAAGFFIGPFVVGLGGYYSEEKHVKWDSNSSTLTIYDGPDLPQLLAVDYDAL
jgi:hypothetical protein